jgi:hypothetical protein
LKRCIRFIPILHRSKTATLCRFARYRACRREGINQRRRCQIHKPAIASANSAKPDANPHHRHTHFYRQRVEPQHQQHRQVFTQVLYRNGITRPDGLLAALLQQRVQRHHEEAAQNTNQDQQAYAGNNACCSEKISTTTPIRIPAGMQRATVSSVTSFAAAPPQPQSRWPPSH